MKEIQAHTESVFIWLLDKWTEITCKGTSHPIKKTFHFPMYIFEELINVVRNASTAKSRGKYSHAWEGTCV